MGKRERRRAKSVEGHLARLALLAVVCTGWPSSGCEDEEPMLDESAAPVEIRFLRHDNLTYLEADNAFFLEYMQAHKNVNIVSTTVDFRTLMATLLGDLKNNTFAYDLVLLPPSRVCSFADNLADVPADVATLAEAQNTFFKAPLDGSTCAGDKLKGLPVEYNLEYGGVVVNLDKYQAKFPGKTPAWPDWESFIAEAAQLSEYDATGAPMANGLDLSPDWSPPFRHIFMSQILQRGGSPMVGSNFDFSTPAAHDSLAAMVDWVVNRKVMWKSLVPAKNTNVTTRLAAGATGYGWSDPAKPLSVMGYLGTWGVPSIKNMVPPGSTWRYEYFPVPPVVGGEHKFVTDSGWAFAVPKSSAHQKVAWDIARSMALSPEVMRRWQATTGTLPALRANGASSAVEGNPTLAKVQPLLERGRWLGFVPAAAIDTANGGMVSNFFAAVAGTKSIDQALMDMQQTANDAIASATVAAGAK